MVVVVGRAAHRIRERGAEVAGDRSDSHLFFVGFFFSFFFPLLFLLWVGFGEASRVVSPCVRPCARLLLVWASRRVALFFFFFFGRAGDLVCVLACVNMGRRAHRQSDADVAGFPIRAASESVRC